MKMPTPLEIWIRAVNSQCLNTLESLMASQHAFFVEGEKPTLGPQNNRRAWQRYFASFPDYQIHIDEVFERADAWYLVGHTYGSHVPREFETIPSSVIWRAVLEGSYLTEWSIYPSDESTRRRFGIPTER